MPASKAGLYKAPTKPKPKTGKTMTGRKARKKKKTFGEVFGKGGY
jgi:hypothetical protein